MVLICIFEIQNANVGEKRYICQIIKI